MKMIKAELPNNSRNKLNEFVRTFIESNMETVEVINEGEYKTTSSMFNALKVTVTRSFPNIKVIQVKGRVYLTKLKIEKE